MPASSLFRVILSCLYPFSALIKHSRGARSLLTSALAASKNRCGNSTSPICLIQPGPDQLLTDEETETKGLSKLFYFQGAELDKHFGHQASISLLGRGVCCLQCSVMCACVEAVLHILILSCRVSSRKSVTSWE